MVKVLQSPSWYRVAPLRPRLRAHARIHRQRFRGEIWYVLQDRQSGRYHRLSPAAHLVVCLMDGRRTLQDIWLQAGTRLGDQQPTQDEIIRLLTQLHAADLLIGEVVPDMEELAHRHDTKQRGALLMKLRNPLSLRFPLFDPDRFLQATLPLVRPVFTVSGFLAWLALVATGAVLAGMHWGALTNDVVDMALSVENVALILAVYPAVKTLHELGHAYAAKVWGGEVHELGIMLLILMPVPYVDASDAASFREPWRRAVVGGAGIMVELALAAFAIMVWLSAEPGAVRAVAFNVMLICGVSTALFNGNPLLRFDGYYIMADLLEIPNLGTRANRYFFYVIQRYAFGIEDLVSPVTGRGERKWFLFFAVASFFYRMSVMLGIALFIGTKLFFVGVMLALWGVANGLLLPLVTGLRYVAGSPQLGRKRSRAVVVTAAAVAGVAALLLAMPVPYSTLAQGVVWLPERSSVRAQTDGDVIAVMAAPGSGVAQGAPLIALEDATLASQGEVLQKQLDEWVLRLAVIRMSDLVQANILREQIRQTEAALELNRKRAGDLVIVAGHDGRFLMPDDADDLPGRYVKKGDLLGYVAGRDDLQVRVVVAQADVDLVRRRTQRVEVRLTERIDEVMPADIVREVPAALSDLPSLALSTQGGGEIALDPTKPVSTPRALESVFQFELRVAGPLPAERIGGRVYVRFDHGTEPIAFRVARAVRQIFLGQFGV